MSAQENSSSEPDKRMEAAIGRVLRVGVTISSV